MEPSAASAEDRAKVEHLVKVIFVGASGTGKTCLIQRLFTDRFKEDAQPTIGCDFFFKRYEFDNTSIGVTLWDTAGAEKFEAVTASYYRGAQGVVFVYDVTRRETLDAIGRYWLPEAERNGTYPDAVKMIMANKIDMVEERAVGPEEGAAFAAELGCMYHETSARTDTGVYDAFVWGLLTAIIDTPSLLRSYGHDRLQVDGAGRGDGGQGGRASSGGCCG